MQNSIDAKVKNSRPVELRFELVSIPQTIPDIDALTEWLEAIKNDGDADNGENSKRN